ncbi:hypothetical protein ACX9NE_28605, partial [Mycobacterium sp. ML4]
GFEHTLYIKPAEDKANWCGHRIDAFCSGETLCKDTTREPSKITPNNRNDRLPSLFDSAHSYTVPHTERRKAGYVDQHHQRRCRTQRLIGMTG